MEQDVGKECQRHPALGDLTAAGHTPLTPLNSQSRSATVTLSPVFNSLINLESRFKHSVNVTFIGNVLAIFFHVFSHLKV